MFLPCLVLEHFRGQHGPVRIEPSAEAPFRMLEHLFRQAPLKRLRNDLFGSARAFNGPSKGIQRQYRRKGR